MDQPTIKFTTPKRGEIYWVDFDPVIGSEQGNRRPCVIVSPNVLNSIEKNRTITVLPISSQGAANPLRVEVSGGKTSGFALVNQLRTIDKSRLQELRGPMDDVPLATVLGQLRKFFS